MPNLNDLNGLVAEAVALGGGDLCAAGHNWVSEGGRTCPKGDHNHASQAVYRCARCGVHDYGDKGGPGWEDCQSCTCTDPEVIEEPSPQQELAL